MTPKPTGPRKTAYSLTLKRAVINVTINASESFEDILINFKISIPLQLLTKLNYILRKS